MGEELWLMLIIHIISKRNNSSNIILLFTLHDRVFCLLFILFIKVSKYSKASCEIKKSANERRN